MANVAWQIEHSVETKAGLGFAWSYMTEVGNWEDPPARFELDGPFAAGAAGRTFVPGQEPAGWRIREVQPQRSYVIETELEGAMLSFEWRFDSISAVRTRLTQTITLAGDQAAKHLEAVRVGFSNISAGMERLAAAVAAAAAGGGSSG